MSTEKKIEWVEIEDPTTRNTFYANPDTGECSWERPSGSIVKPKDELGEWWELWDDNHNLPYYYNTKNGQTEWIKPENATIIPLQKIQQSSVGKRMSRTLSILLEPNANGVLELGSHLKSGSSVSTAESGATPSVNDLDQQNSTQQKVPFEEKTLVETVTKNDEEVSPSGTSSRPATPEIKRVKLPERNTSLRSAPNSTAADPNSANGHRPSRPTNSSKSSNESITPPLSRLNNTTQRPGSPSSGNSASANPVRKSSLMTNMDSEMVWKMGISEPVPNPEAAAAMSPLRNHEPAPNSETAATTNPPQDESSYKVTPQNEKPYSIINTLPPELVSDINQFAIDGFAKKYFATHKKGLFRRTVPIEKMLVWTKDSIKKPLLVLPAKALPKDAVNCFKIIQRVMGDRPKKQEINKETQALLEYGIMHGELRDEIYVQLCKQLKGNPNRESIIKGWELLCVVIVTFPPSKNFEQYLESYLRGYTRTADNHVDVYSKHCINQLARICKRGPKGKVPTIAEIERAKESPFKPSIFGETLEFVMSLQAEIYPDLTVPAVMPFLTKSVLQLNGKSSEGIFRVPGEQDDVTELRLRIETGNYDLGKLKDPNVPASLVKFWLRDLTDAVIPNELYDECIRNSEDLDQCLRIVSSLQPLNRRVLLFMIKFLQEFADPEVSKQTKMTVHNLAMVFAPNFLRCPTDSLTRIFENSKYEIAFMRTIILGLNIDPSWDFATKVQTAGG